MARTDRLLDLVQMLRRHRLPVSGEALALELDVSLRTLYRDIATLRAQGADIQGEPGIGYVLKPGFLLPPLMFSEDELEALVLGMRWVARRTGGSLSTAADNALARISAVLPKDLKDQLDSTLLLVGPTVVTDDRAEDITLIRTAIRRERKLLLSYQDASGEPSDRKIWPFALGFFDQVRVIAAWCELRNDFRHFRTDRIIRITAMEERYPKRKNALLRTWRDMQTIGEAI
ncbi:DNA-binding protein [Rhizobium sp. Root149]|uniref:Putative DNA-binding transcriptional regulator YafY n=1 Tax=Rhizobium rhizoryzae TaxID=451876 RepID=A0A7W6PPA3_9HYPH|nr:MULTISPECIES: YafY family protein [Rhizobium]KQZ55179.1 DNA-binding protein [Rhizobium sp. Root149]MBB4142288.1 putative DNA-binding transcriptional regulator YafY [Rhizobium rhizoryzae]